MDPEQLAFSLCFLVSKLYLDSVGHVYRDVLRKVIGLYLSTKMQVFHKHLSYMKLFF